jgi:hypothetical protein
MTLSTNIVIRQPVPAETLFRYCQSLLGPVDAQVSSHEKDYNGDMAYYNKIGQGLPALMSVHYGADGPMRAGEVNPDDYEGGEASEDYQADLKYTKNRRGCVRINFDTGYGYKAPNGAECNDLHAWLIVKVFEWLQSYPVEWVWEQEFTGEWYDSVLDVHQLGDPEKGALK